MSRSKQSFRSQEAGNGKKNEIAFAKPGYVDMTHHHRPLIDFDERGVVLTSHKLGFKNKETGPRAQAFLCGYVSLTGHSL